MSTLLKTGGHQPIIDSLGMWKHESRKIICCLCVDEFWVKFCPKEDVQHLHDTIVKEYTCKIDWTVKHFLGYKIDWHYDEWYMNISMPDYIKKDLIKLLYKAQVLPQYLPHEFISTKWTKKGDR